MTQSHFGWLTGATLLILTLAMSAPAFAFNTPSGGGGGGGNSDSSSIEPSAPHKTSAPTMATIQADIKASDWTKSIADLKLFLKANPKSADGWNLLGYSYRQHGDLKLADTAYDRALKLNPNHIDALSYQGILYVKLGEKSEAQANLAKIGKICGNTTCPQYVALQQALS